MLFLLQIKFKKNIEIIGFGNAVLKVHPEFCRDNFINLKDGTCIHFKNIKFSQMSRPTSRRFMKDSDVCREMWIAYSLFTIRRGSNLFMSDCKVEIISCVGINCKSGGNVYVRNCVFMGMNKKNGCIAIKADSCSQDLFVSNCSFFHFGNLNESHEDKKSMSCIKIQDGLSMARPICINFDCVGNIFENNYDYPIGVDLADKFCDFGGDKYLRIYQNRLRGFNGLHVGDTMDDANCVWIKNADTNHIYVQFERFTKCNEDRAGRADEESDIINFIND